MLGVRSYIPSSALGIDLAGLCLHALDQGSATFRTSSAILHYAW